MFARIIISLFLGACIGYLIFYFRFENREIINELRKNVKHISKENEQMDSDLQEFLAQNTILKEKVSELIQKNDDLSKIVSELSMYYYHIKLASEKMSELSKCLQVPEPSFESKIKQYSTDKKNKKNTDSDLDNDQDSESDGFF